MNKERQRPTKKWSHARFEIGLTKDGVPQCQFKTGVFLMAICDDNRHHLFVIGSPPHRRQLLVEIIEALIEKEAEEGDAEQKELKRSLVDIFVALASKEKRVDERR